eukprot:m.20936 g.20936  ORF g.20936 m.20936 type:complete len:136 (-) comp8992_c0_seq1:1928-2335(-)
MYVNVEVMHALRLTPAPLYRVAAFFCIESSTLDQRQAQRPVMMDRQQGRGGQERFSSFNILPLPFFLLLSCFRTLSSWQCPPQRNPSIRQVVEERMHWTQHKKKETAIGRAGKAAKESVHRRQNTKREEAEAERR